MIPEKMNYLFPSGTRKILMMISVLSGFLCIFLVRYFSDGTLKIAFLYGMYIFIMLLVVFYKNFINKYEISIFCFLIIQLLAVAPNLEDFRGATVQVTYLLSFRYGVSSRSFIATIIDFFTKGGFVSKYFVWHFVFSSTVFLSFIISTYLGYLIKTAKNDIQLFVMILSLLWLSCFTTPVTYFHQINFGRIEMFAMFILFFVIFIINKPIIRYLIPLLTVITMAIHLNLVFFYIPFIFILLLYTILEKPEKSRKNIIFLFTTTITILGMFFCYLLIREKTFVFKDAHTFYTYLLTKSNLNFNEENLHSLMYASLEDHLIGWRARVNLRFLGNLSIFINLPLLLLFVIFWMKCFIEETKKTMKLFFLIPVLVLLYHAVAFFLFWDFARWMIMILNVQFMLVFYLIYVRNITVLSVVQTITPIAKRNAFLIILICLILIFLGPVQNIGPSDRVLRIFEIILQNIKL
jgi:hypothetical protein